MSPNASTDSTPPPPPRARRARKRPAGLPRNAVLYRMEHVAAALGWRVETTRLWLIRHEAAIQIGRLWYTTRKLLRMAFPRVWDEVVAAAEEARMDDDGE